MSHTHGVDSEVGRLRTVLVHRPGLELRRITPRSASRLLFDGLPWVGRAQQEHDSLARVLRDHGVEVLYVTELLQDALEYQPARNAAIGAVMASAALGDELQTQVHAHLDGLDPEALTQALIAGLTPDELRMGRGVVFELLDRHDFVIEPLPNLVFSRDSSVWISDRVAVSSLATAQRRREPALIQVIRVPASELGSHRGGPRCMVCPVTRDPAASPDASVTASEFAAPDLSGLGEAVTQPHGMGLRPIAPLAPAGWASAPRGAC